MILYYVHIDPNLRLVRRLHVGFRIDVLACARRVVNERGENRFTVREIFALMQDNGMEQNVWVISVPGFRT